MSVESLLHFTNSEAIRTLLKQNSFLQSAVSRLPIEEGVERALELQNMPFAEGDWERPPEDSALQKFLAEYAHIRILPSDQFLYCPIQYLELNINAMRWFAYLAHTTGSRVVFSAELERGDTVYESISWDFDCTGANGIIERLHIWHPDGENTTADICLFKHGVVFLHERSFYYDMDKKKEINLEYYKSWNYETGEENTDVEGYMIYKESESTSTLSDEISAEQQALLDTLKRKMDGEV